MEKVVTAAEMKKLDAHTIHEIGVPSLVLMERAALAVRDEILTAYPISQSKVVVVAGSGNNGGDGLAVARLLKIAGVNVSILNVGNPEHASDEHKVQEQICKYYHIPETTNLNVLDDATLIVDAIFGIGIDREIQGHYVDVIKAMNEVNAPIVAVDMPSGINTDTGEVMGIAVQADATVTFAYNKVGLTKNAGKDHAGRIAIANDMGTYDM